MLRKIIWPLLSFISIVLSIVFIVGFITSINISKEEKNDYAEGPNEIEQTSVETPKHLSGILVMGDSIGFGIGDEENLGLGERYLEMLNKNEETEIELTNISVPGYESDELLNLIKSEENRSIIYGANLIIISIGGNDLNRLEYEDSLILNITFKEALDSYKEDLTSIIKEIRSINTEAQLSIIGLYNPYSNKEPATTKFILEWNYATRLIVASDFKCAYIPTYEQFEYHLDDYLSVDGFHPSALGYQAITETLYKILN